MKILPYAHFQPAPLREVRPAGWLADFLDRQATGLTSNVAVSGYPYGYKFWGSQGGDIQGSYGSWWPYEQTGYWIDGALKCGYLAGDQALYQQALAEIDFAVDHAASDGFIGPEPMRHKDRWPYAVFFRAVLAQYEISGDERYLQALTRHYRALPHPMDWDRDVSGVEILLELYRESGEADLLAMATDLYARFNQKFPGHDCALDTLRSERALSEHGVTFNELAKLAAHLYCASGETEILHAVTHGYEKLEHQALLADGLHSCSEHIQGSDWRDMHETCDITDHTWALAYLLQASGEVRYADRIEQVIFNALPGSITKDFRALQYFSSPNQVIASAHSNHNRFMRGLNWMSYRPDHEVQCCPGNLHRAMPNFIAKMWMRSPERDGSPEGDGSPNGGIVAALYGPGTLQTTAGKTQTSVRITAQTRYPYQQSVEFQIEPQTPVSFPFIVRIPGWCAQARLSVNGDMLEADLVPGSFYPIERRWQPGDVVRLDLPFSLALHRWPGEGISLTYGPLTLSYPVPMEAQIETHNSTIQQRKDTLGDSYQPRPVVSKPDFPAWELFPAGPWNYALCLDENSLDDLQVVWNPDCQDPLSPDDPAFTVRVKARRVRRWRLVHTHRARQWGHWVEAGEFHRGLRTVHGDFHFTPPFPDPQGLTKRLMDEVEEIELVPYGNTLLRVTVFPQA